MGNKLIVVLAGRVRPASRECTACTPYPPILPVWSLRARTGSDFDYGTDVLGRPGATGPQTTTTFNESISGLDPSGPSIFNFLSIQTDDRAIPELPIIFSVLQNSTSLNVSYPANTPEDWSKITTLYVSEFAHDSEFDFASSGAFTGYVLGPAQTVSNVSFVNGGTNSISATLSPSPLKSTPFNILGSAWAALSPVGPGSPSPLFSDFAIYVQPYVADRYVLPATVLSGIPSLSLLFPTAPATGPVVFPGLYGCSLSTGSTLFTLPGMAFPPPILADTDYGPFRYGDPYPASWLRLFQYCQVSPVALPRPNSTTVDTFYVINKQTTAPPSAPVAPILSPVQAPTLNGSSLFTSTTLNTTNVTISWDPPATGQPFAYFVTVRELVTNSVGTTGYAVAGGYFTAKTSVKIPFLTAANTYVFTILAAIDGKANIETSPLRHKIPIAESGVVSAPFVIAPGATP